MPSSPPIDVDSCPHRRAIPGPPGDAECGLLVAISGVDGPLARVGRDACEACREQIPPTSGDLNPTVASLLHGLAGRVIAAGGVAGCHSGRARELARRAEADLALRWDGPAVGPSARGNPGARVRVGLIGWNTPTGLGHLNRDLARHLPADRWLIPTHPVFRELSEEPPCPTLRRTRPDDLRDFLDGIDCLLFCERPCVPGIVPMARSMGVRVACVPMWEFLDELAPWVRLVDRMICPTLHCRDFVLRHRERLGLSWDVEHLPWPIDLARFPFRRRDRCDRFLFVNGTGGARGIDPGLATWDGRKGVGVVAEAARRAPSVPILVRSQTADLPPFPPSVEVRIGDPEDPADLYAEGDVCIQPSRWEGLGLTMLECQASGLPLITADAPPMTEHRPIRRLRSTASGVRLGGLRPIPAHQVDPADLARAMVGLLGTDLARSSVEARRFVETSHDWASAGPRLRQLL